MNFFGSSSTNNEATQAELGSRLYNIKQSSIGTESVLSILPDNNVVVNTCSSFGKSLLNVSSLNGLVGLLNSADSKVEVIDSGTGSIDFTLDNALKLSVKNLYTEVMNELRGLNINPYTDLEYSLGTYTKRWNNIYGSKIVDTIATRGWNSSIPFMQNTNSAMNSSQNVLWQHTTNDSTPSNFQLLIETKDVGGIYERMQISSYRNAYRNLHLQPSGKVLIGGDYSAINNSTISTLDVNGATTVRGSITGQNFYSNHIYPNGTDSYDMGTGVNQYRNIYTNSVRQFSATNPLKFFTNSDTERMVISKDGYVGIGITSPSTLLDVNGATTVRGHITPDGSGQRDLGANGTRFRTLYTEDISVSGKIYSTTTATPIILAQDTTERARINASGQLEVKTATINNGAIKISTPSQNLNQTTFIGFSGDGSDGNDRARVGCRFGSTGGGNLFFTTGGSGTQFDRMVITDTGVGIGMTPASNYILDVRKTGGDAYARISGDVAQKQGFIFSDGATPTDIWTFYKKDTTKTLNIYNNSTSSDLMTFTTGNLVGISNTSPTEKLDISGNLRIAGNIITDGVGTRNIGSLANPYAKIFTVDADISNLVSNCKTYNLTPSANNQYTIGASSTNQYNAIYGNNIYANGVSVSSDRRLKENIKPISNGLETVLKMKPVEYKMKNGVRLHTGFLADEMEHLYNNEDWACFVEQKDEVKTQSLQYMEVIAILAKAIQDLNSKVVKIENRKLVGSSVIDTSSLTEDMTQIYERLDHLSTKVSELENQPVKPQLHRCVEISRINELYDRITNLELNETKASNSEDIELIHSLMEKINFLELKNQELESKIERLPKIVESKSSELLESDGGLNMNELLQQKNFELETRLIKLEKQNKRLVQAVNKLLKSNDV